MTEKKSYMSDEKIIQHVLSVDTIQGMSVLEIYSVNDKIIFLFGENHSVNPKKCTGSLNSVNLVDYLDTFFRYSSVCCDFFIEMPEFLPYGRNADIKYAIEHGKFKSTYGQNESEESNLRLLDNKYSECIRPYNKEVCRDFGNVRMHNIEFRRHNIPIMFKNMEITTQINTSKKYSYEKLVDVYRKLFIYLLENDVKHALEIMFEFRGINMFNDISSENINYYVLKSRLSKLAKQLYQLPSNVKNDLIDFFDQRVKTWTRKGRLRQPTIDKELLPVLIMDAYAISRILKSIYIYKDSGILFTCTGKNHLFNYKWFLLEKCNAKKVYSSIPDEELSEEDTENEACDETCVCIGSKDRKKIADALTVFYSKEKQSICSLKIVDPPV
jgi:hypothetical protein